jgi:phage terminase small subunit
MNKSNIIKSMLKTAKDLGLSPTTMKEIEVLALNKIKYRARS